MTVARIHSRYAVQTDVADPSVPVLLGGITRQRIGTASDVRGEATSGEIYRRLQALYAQKPLVEFSSYAIADCLDEIGLTGAVVENGGMNYYAQKWTEGSTPAGAGSHREFNVLEGVVVPRRLACNHQGDYVIDYEHLITYDGTNDPIVVTDSSNLPAGIVDNERFTLYSATIESVALAQAQNLEIDFGVDARTEGGDSDIWDTFARVRKIEPRLRLTGTDIEWFKAANIPLIGKSATHANTTILLRKRAEGGTFVADETEEHISITCAGLCYVDVAFDDDGDEPATVSLEFPLRYDGTNAVLVIDTTAALT